MGTLVRELERAIVPAAQIYDDLHYSVQREIPVIVARDVRKSQ
jgi:hypothetical protein